MKKVTYFARLITYSFTYHGWERRKNECKYKNESLISCQDSCTLLSFKTTKLKGHICSFLKEQNKVVSTFISFAFLYINRRHDDNERA